MAHNNGGLADVSSVDQAVEPSGKIDVEEVGPRLVLSSKDLGNLPTTGRRSLADQSLDLVLNEIAEQARLATTACGAIIALTRGSELVVRAMAGVNAAEVAVLLNTKTEIVSACVRTGVVRHFDDLEKDLRIEGSRRLGCRSLLIAPAKKNGDVVGVIQVFAAHPQAFRNFDSVVVESLSRRIVANLDLAQQLHTTVTNVAPVVRMPRKLQMRLPYASMPLWSVACCVAIVALAALGGWSMGRRYERRVQAKAADSRLITSVARTIRSSEAPVLDTTAGVPNSIPSSPSESVEPNTFAVIGRAAGSGRHNVKASSTKARNAPDIAVSSATQPTRPSGQAHPEAIVLYENER